MMTIIDIATEYNMQPSELAAFFDLGRDVDYEKELDEEEAQNIIYLLEFDRVYSH